MSVVTPRVVVVSESRITRRVVEMTFADQPLQLAVFTAGSAAADDWQTRPPSLLIADVAMQAPDGYALAQQLRAHPAGHKASVILLAGQSDVVDEPAVAAARVSTVLRKPLDSNQLVDAVRQALRSGPPPAAVPAAQPVVSAAATVVTIESAPAPAVSAFGGAEAGSRSAGSDVAVLVGQASALDAEATAGARREAQPETVTAAAGLADTFHALLDVEQGLRPSLAPAPLDDDEVDRIAMRVAGLVATDAGLVARIESAIVGHVEPAAASAAEREAARLALELVATIADRVVREIAPALVDQIAHSVVRDEIARLRGAARVA